MVKVLLMLRWFSPIFFCFACLAMILVIGGQSQSVFAAQSAPKLGQLVKSSLSQPKLPLIPLYQQTGLKSRYIPQPVLPNGKWEMAWFSEGALPLSDLLFLAGHTINGYWVEDGKIVTTPAGGFDVLQETILRISALYLDIARYQELSASLAKTAHRLSPLKQGKYRSFWEIAHDRHLRMQASAERSYQKLQQILPSNLYPAFTAITWSNLYQPVIIPKTRLAATKQALSYQSDLAPMLGEGVLDPLLASPLTSSHRREKQTLSFDKAKIDGMVGSRVGGFSTMGAKLQMHVPIQTAATQTSLAQPTDWVSQKLGLHLPRTQRRKWVSERIAVSYDALVAANRDQKTFNHPIAPSNQAQIILNASEQHVSALNSQYASYFAKLQILAAMGQLSEQLLSYP